MTMIVEDKILEYLDGSLGESESAELLETLSVSPEKRALLEEHLRLKDLFALGRKPFSVPIETERQLARRIPILGRYSDNLAPARWAFSGVRRFIGARAIGLAVGAGAMLMLVGLGWYSMSVTGSKVTTAGKSLVRVSSSPVGEMSAANSAQPTSQEFSSAASAISSPTAMRGILKHRTILNNITRADLKSPIASAPQKEEEPSSDIAQVTPITSLRESSASIPNGRVPQTLSEIRMGEPDKLSPMTVGSSLILDESYLPTLSTGPQHTLQKLLEDVMMDYDLSPNFAIGIEVGEGMSSSLTNTQLTNPSADYTRVVNTVGVGGQTIYDAMLTFHYTLFPESEYQFRLGAAGGSAFTAGPMAEFTAGISRVLAPGLLLDVTAAASRVWTNGSSPVLGTNANGVIGIVGAQVPPQSMYTTAFGVRAGLRIRL
jgi:hypothetical protein